ncbi:MAG: DUF4864 domain-containing protein [Nitriliruptoraceae bacterium]
MSRHRSAAAVGGPLLFAAIAMVAVIASACADPVTEPAATAPSTAQPDGTDPQDADPDPDAAGPSDDGPDADPDADRDAARPEDDGSDAAPDRAGPQNRLPDDHLAGPGVCIAEVEREVLDTIGAQLDDLARRDFAAALSQATTAFQAGTDAAAFRALIEGSFPLLLEDATAELSGCFRPGPATVEARVEVTTGDRVSAPFVYRLRLDGGRWAIDAAARLTAPPATA